MIKNGKTVIYLIICFLCFFACSNVASEKHKNNKCEDIESSISSESTYYKFLDSLKNTVRKRDSEAFTTFLSIHVKNINGETGVGEFIKYWKLGNNESQLWGLLTLLLSFKGTLTDSTTYVIPSLSLQELPRYNSMIVFEPTFLFTADNVKSEKVSILEKGDTISYFQNNYNYKVFSSFTEKEIISLCQKCWLNVSKGSKLGYVQTNKLWDVNTGLILILSKEKNGWKINSIQGG